MRTLFIVTLISVKFLSISFAEQYDVMDALNKKIIQLKVTYDISHSHYSFPLKGTFSNLTNKPVVINFSAGQLFQADDTLYQSFVCNQGQLVQLNPSGKRMISINGMCINTHRSAGTTTNTYSVAQVGNKNLIVLAKYIEEHKLFNNYEAQNAMWCISDNNPLEDIVGYDTSSVRKLQRFVAGITGKPVPRPPSMDDYRHNYYSTRILKKKIKGEFEFNIAKTREFYIAMKNKDGVVVRELFQKQNLEKGKHKVNFEFDATCYTEKKYFIDLYRDGVQYTRQAFEL